ncbi:alpha/beta-hydrolase [Ramaria rubella]|nr:alpha/beta-hydrolase [Ramaria rubella]
MTTSGSFGAESNGFTTLTVDTNGTVLSYIDTGVPESAPDTYTTIFAVHGFVYTSPIFQHVMNLAPAQGIRFVAINRRDYPGSTPLSATDHGVLANGTDSEKTAYLNARGIEIANFMYTFMQKFSIPSLSSDKKHGGFALLGWSLGNAITIAAVAAWDTLPETVARRLKPHFKAFILHEPPFVALGTPVPPQHWSPAFDTTIPAHLRTHAFTQWITSYFKHGDLSTMDLSVLSWVLPATVKPPSIYNMSPEDMATIVWEASSDYDILFMLNFMPQFLTQYHKALFDNGTRQFWQNMDIWALCGDVTCSTMIPAFWDIQKENTARGGNLVKIKSITGVNHFMHWDFPRTAFQAYLEGVGR